MVNTRFYFPSSGAALINPAFSNLWEKTSGADRLKTKPYLTYTPFKSKSFSENYDGNSYDILNRQYISNPLSGQQIFTNVGLSGQLKCSESSSNADFKSAIIIKLVGNTGNIKDYIYYNFIASSEWSSSGLVNRYLPMSGICRPSTGISGDRIVFEIGARANSFTTGLFSGTQQFGDNAVFNDLPLNETETGLKNPWVAFNTKININ